MENIGHYYLGKAGDLKCYVASVGHAEDHVNLPRNKLRGWPTISHVVKLN